MPVRVILFSSAKSSILLMSSVADSTFWSINDSLETTASDGLIRTSNMPGDLNFSLIERDIANHIEADSGSARHPHKILTEVVLKNRNILRLIPPLVTHMATWSATNLASSKSENAL